MKITVVGSGYVGTSNAVLLAQHNKVALLDLVEEKVNKINNKVSPIEDEMISRYLLEKDLDLVATTDKVQAYQDADYVIVAVPTDYNPETKYFNTSLVEKVIKDAKTHAPADVTIVIKSTIPVGFVKRIRTLLEIENVIFSPEFLREGSALQDNLYPDRIIVGEVSERAETFAALLQQGAEKKDIPVLFMGATEAEAVKLFANSYLAMRVAFFNELDMYAEVNKLNTEDIIKGASLDHRIGDYYNNPSFGYGGYCFPKDTKQLLANFEGVPNNLIQAIVDSNETRKNFITDQILSMRPRTVGIFRLTMKAGSDNFRSSAIQDIIEKIRKHDVDVVIYEPTYKDTNLNGIPVINNIDEFCEMSDFILANRVEPELELCKKKVYTRDIFMKDK